MNDLGGAAGPQDRHYRDARVAQLAASSKRT